MMHTEWFRVLRPTGSAAWVPDSAHMKFLRDMLYIICSKNDYLKLMKVCELNIETKSSWYAIWNGSFSATRMERWETWFQAGILFKSGRPWPMDYGPSIYTLPKKTLKTTCSHLKPQKWLKVAAKASKCICSHFKPFATPFVAAT